MDPREKVHNTGMYVDDFENPIPEEALDDLVPCSRILKARKDLVEMAEAYKELKKECIGMQRKQEERRKIVHKKELDLKAFILGFDKHLATSDIKRAEAFERTIRDRKATQGHIRTIEKLQDSVDTLETGRLKMQKRTNTARLYYNYLISVSEKTGSFAELTDIIKRHESLVAIREDLSKREGVMWETLVHMLADLREERLKHLVRMKDMEKQLLEMRIYQEELAEEIQELKRNLDTICIVAARNFAEEVTAEESIFCMYRTIMIYKEHPIQLVSVDSQLRSISAFIQNMSDIHKQNTTPSQSTTSRKTSVVSITSRKTTIKFVS